jgi:hypothetical protein
LKNNNVYGIILTMEQVNFTEQPIYEEPLDSQGTTAPEEMKDKNDFEEHPVEASDSASARAAKREKVIDQAQANFRTARRLGRSGLTMAEVRALKAIRRSGSLR